MGRWEEYSWIEEHFIFGEKLAEVITAIKRFQSHVYILLYSSK